jgi:transcriptional regulator with XRE-family HTH domain
MNGVGCNNRLREVRLQKGLTQKELAVRLGVTASAVASYEVATRNLRFPTMRRLAAALGCDVSAFSVTRSSESLK